MITMPIGPVAPESTESELQRAIDEIAELDPWLGLTLVRALGSAAAPTRATVAMHLLDAVAIDRRLGADADRVVERARAAQEIFDNWTDERVDRLLRDIAAAFAARAEPLAEMTVKVTQMGKIADKAITTRFASVGVYESLAGKPAQGMLSFDPDRQVTEIASAIGVILGVVPSTSPIATAIFKTLIALKARNALILCFPRQAQGLGTAFGQVVRPVLDAHGAPADLVQWIDRHGSRRLTSKFMRHPGVSFILATGGAELVRAAHQSGKPAIAAGPGNVPAWISADADLSRAARAIVKSKAFDNGLIAGAEANLVADERIIGRFAAALEQEGAAVLTPIEVDRLAAVAIASDSRAIRREFVGRSASTIARVAGITRPHAITLLVVSSEFALDDAFNAREKLAPIVSLFAAAGEDQGLQWCRSMLAQSGAGHTAVIHTTNAARVERFARAMSVGRVLVNTPAAQGCAGMTTGLDSSLTLGCGTFGGSATTANVTYRHLLNIKRVARDLGGDRLRV